MINVTIETKVVLYFEVTSYPPPLADPQVTFNNSSLYFKWKVGYISSDVTLSSSFSFLIEITTENFMQEDIGVYSVTVTNACASSTKTVTLTGKQVL